ncbi:hypothetical protein V8G54_010651 [Vigna mungo]|uniref:Uncharacterized protein n=1 Tax=Vigna mungo TaxID=3915 RepID=A0AAQ3NX21_VIGMU
MDEMSTASFFRDKSMTLGSLMRISSFLEVSRRSSKGRLEQPSKNNENNHKLRPWLFSLCSKLTTDAVSVSAAGNNLLSERKAANHRRNNHCSTIYGHNDLFPVQESKSLFVGGHVAHNALEKSNGYGKPVTLCCLCR